MAKIAKKETQDKLATILADYPELRSFIEKGENLEDLQTVALGTSTINFVPGKAIREISKVIKLGSSRELNRSDLFAAYCLGKSDATEAQILRLTDIIQQIRERAL